MPETKPNVLVVDDDLLALELYARELREDYQITLCENVADARRQLQQQKPEILIIEPAVNEDEGWALLKETHAAPNQPLIILCSVEDDRKAGLGQGAQAYLVKPVLPATLHALLDQMVAKRLFQSGSRLEKGS